MRERLLKAQTEIIYTLMVGTMRLPDPVLAALLSQLYSIASLLAEDKNDELVLRLQEMAGYFADKSSLSEALRKMIVDARPSQVKSMIRGYLVNYVYEW